MNKLVVFALDDQRYALAFAVVEKVIRAVEITPLPQAPEIVSGAINVQGKIVPVVEGRGGTLAAAGGSGSILVPL